MRVSLTMTTTTSSESSASPTRVDRKLEEVNLQLEDEFQEDDFLMKRTNAGVEQVNWGLMSREEYLCLRHADGYAASSK